MADEETRADGPRPALAEASSRDAAVSPPATRQPRTTGRAVRQQSMRHHNLGVALRCVLDAPEPVSRADIAQTTGLARATVSALVDRLVGARLVTELTPIATQRAGRPAVPLVPARGTVAAVGMEVNVDYLGVRAIDLAGRVVSERLELGDFRGSEPGQVLDRLARLAGSVLALLSADGVDLVGTALALPGLVDRVTGPLRLAPNLGWRDVDVVGLLAAHPVLAGLPPRLANEAKLASRAEAHVRRHAGPASFLYVSGEVGIGMAIVLDGEIYPGRHGWSGEIGHTVVSAAGDREHVSTLESQAGQDAILDRAGLPRSTTPDELVALADSGHAGATDSLRVAGEALGLALANVVNVVDVDHVVLGGIYGALGGWLRDPVARQLERGVLSAPWSPVGLSVARAGQYPAMTGGALAVLRAFVDDPAVWAGDEV